MFGKKVDKKSGMEIFAVFDTKTQTYGMPAFAINQHDMVREIYNMFRDPQQQTKNQLWLNAEDYSVFRIGTYSREGGELLGQNPEHIANLHELKASVLADISEKPQTGPVGMHLT